jgi:hypothetical protein
MLQWQLVSLTAAKIKPLIIFVSRLALSYAVNLVTLMILYDLCLLPAQFYHIIIYMWKAESCVQITDQCPPWKISNGAAPYFADTAISKGGRLPQIPSPGKHKSLLT